MRLDVQPIGRKDNMEGVEFRVGDVSYTLSEEKSLGEGIYYLKSNDGHPITITIMKVTVKCPDGSKTVLFTYDPEGASGATNIAVANVATKYLERNNY